MPEPTKPAPRSLPEDLVPWVQLEPDGSAYLQLEYPRDWAGERIERLHVRRVTGAIMRKLPDTISTAKALDLLGELSGQAPRVIDLLDAEDVMRGSKLVGFFLGSSRTDGSTP